VDILALNEKKMTAQVDLIAAQSEVIVAKCMFEKTNRKFFDPFGVLISEFTFEWWSTALKVH
jgi:hypothetical protein